jgi:hypothetical protein
MMRPVMARSARRDRGESVGIGVTAGLIFIKNRDSRTGRLGSPGVRWFFWGAVLLAARVDGVLLAASVGLALSPSSRVVVLLKSDFLAYYC